jgi:hypothetical protein
VVRSSHVGTGDRRGVIKEVRGEAGGPPYVVGWEDGHEGLFFPGPDATIETSRTEQRTVPR